MSIKDRVGRCYELALKGVTRGFRGWDALCHGFLHWGEACIHHAWLERGGEVFDPVMNETFPADAYYALFDAQEVVRYTPKEAMELALSTGHCGPWQEIDDSRLRTLPREEAA